MSEIGKNNLIGEIGSTHLESIYNKISNSSVIGLTKDIYLIQRTFNGSNADGSITMAVSNSFLSPVEKIP